MIKVIRFSCFRATCLLLTAALVVWTAGCSGEPTGSVAGKVVHRGKPLTGWDVQMYSKKLGVGASGSLDSAGRFAIANPLPTGIYEVYLTPPTPPEPTPDKEATPTKPAQTIPPRYADAKTSGLSFPVEVGPNEFVIELKD